MNYFKTLNKKNYISIRDKISALFDWVNGVVQFQSPITLSYSSSLSWDVGTNYNAKVTLTGNTTISLSGLQPGCYGNLEVVQGGVGGYSITLPSNSKVVNGGGGVVTLSSGVGDIDIISFYYNGTTIYWTVLTDFT